LFEAKRILHLNLEHRNLDLPEIQAVEVEDVVSYKARYAYAMLNESPVIIEDTGLYLDAWNGLPGALIKWFLEKVGDKGVCDMLSQFSNRLARAKTAVATYDGKLTIFYGEVRGRIADNPIGEEGFGWDRLFIPDGSKKTFAQMLPDEKDRFSMRRIAFQKMNSHFSNTNP
jgi:non-canonical purine NTP pyrophosphatase (RdgB/HAM1 family)